MPEKSKKFSVSS